MRLKPVNDKIVVKVNDTKEEEKTISGIILPDSVGGKILAKAQGAWGSSSNNPVRLEFYTEDGNTGSSGLGSPRMVIDKDGQVGIGTVSPLALLHVQTADVAISPAAGVDSLDVNVILFEFSPLAVNPP